VRRPAAARRRALQGAALAAVLIIAAPTAKSELAGGTVFVDCEGCPEMVALAGGSFMMGDHSNGGHVSEWPPHLVAVAPFAIGQTEVTVAQFRAFVDATGHAATEDCGLSVATDRRPENWRDPSFEQGDDHPVVCVSWHDAQAYAAWVSTLSGQHYRLPTEAEWEFAARGGTITAYWWGPQANSAKANYRQGTKDYPRYRFTQPAGSYPANPFGLYEVLGNVWEWTEDCWAKNHEGAPTDGSARLDADCSARTYRGGSWYFSATFSRSAKRTAKSAEEGRLDLGFRLARDLP